MTANIYEQLEQLEATYNAEIERLREKISAQDIEILGFNLERRDLKSLLYRAADALERIEAAKHWQWTINLAAELRKAAE